MGTWAPGPGATSGGDTYQGDGANDVADGLGGDDALNGGAGDDTLIGNDGNDVLAPSDGNDTMTGGAGDDYVNLLNIWTGSGDSFDGGADNDSLHFFAISDTRFELSVMSLTSIEGLVFTHGGGSDVSRVALAGSQIGAGVSATATITGDDLATDSLTIEFASATTFVNSFSYVSWEARDLTVLSGSGADDSLTGSAFSDELYGNDGHDTLSAGDGADRLEGGVGNDILSGGAGGDILLVGTGTDIANAGDDDDDILVFDTDLSVGDTFNGGNGTDTLHLFNNSATTVFALNAVTIGGIERIDNSSQTGFGEVTTQIANTQLGAGFSANLVFIGSTSVDDIINIISPGAGDINLSGWTITNWDGDDSISITGTTGGEHLTGSSRGDSISGLAGIDVLNGGGGDDFLNGGAGADTMSGGAGADTYFVDDAGDVVSEAASADFDIVWSSVTFILGANVENLVLTGAGAITGYGNIMNNAIDGNGAANSLYGFDGNDSLNGGAGADQMFGGNGDDAYLVDNAGDQTIEVSPSGGTDNVFSSVSRNLTANIENLTLTGSAALTGAGNSLNNVILGNSGANTLYGFDGNDVVDGGAGADTLFGANGDDTYVVDDVGDITVEGSPAGGIDTVQSFISRNLNANFENMILMGTAAIAYGNVLNNELTGNASANSLYGFDGNDTLDGGAGIDQMFGANGDDTYIVDNVSDVTSEVSPAGGTDTVLSSVTRNLTANLENLTLTGVADITGAGNALNNVVTGNSGINTLYGLDGADTLDGGLGADTLQGGNGADTYVFSSAIGGGNVDAIVNFSVVDDTIQLNNSVFTGLGAGTLDANAFHIGAAAGDADDRIIYNSGTGAVYFDADGNGAGAAVQFATLTTGLALTNNDFLISGP